MAKLSDEAQLDVANKLTLGIVSTNTDKNYFEEDFAWSPTVLASEIWADEIPFATTQAEADDVVAGLTTDSPTVPVVEKLTLYQMDEVPLSNEQAWAIYEVPGVADPDTRIVDWLNPQQFGAGYFFELYENDNTPIALTDGRYQVDSKNGIVRFDEGFTPADLGLLTPLKITLYRYNGRKGVIVDITPPSGGDTESGVPHQEIITFSAITAMDGNGVIGSASFAVANPDSFRLFVNKILQTQGQEYNLTGPFGNQIEWLVDSHGIELDPAEDQIVALYTEANFALSQVPQQQELTPENIGPTDGDTILTDILDYGVDYPESVRLFLNKQFQVQGAGRDYSLTGPSNRQIVWQTGSGSAVQMMDTDELVAAYLVDADNAVGPTGPAFTPATQLVSSNITLSREVDQYVGLMTGGTFGFTVTLPASPQEGDRVWVKDEDGNASVNNVYINGNGNPIDGDITAEYLIAVDEQGVVFFYANGGWRIF